MSDTTLFLFGTGVVSIVIFAIYTIVSQIYQMAEADDIAPTLKVIPTLKRARYNDPTI